MSAADSENNTEPESGKGAGSQPPARQLTARGRDRRQKLLDFATERFAQNGFHPTSVSDIVDGIGVGKGVFYWYFPSKDDLLLEILREALVDVRRFQRAHMDPGDDPLRQLEDGIRASLTWSADNPNVWRLVMFAWTEEKFAKSLRRGRRITIQDTTKLVSAAMEDGLIKPGDATMLATAVRGVTDELGRQYAVGNKPLSEEVLDNAVRFCLYGLAG